MEILVALLALALTVFWAVYRHAGKQREAERRRMRGGEAEPWWGMK